jgi:hypothetical protein
MGTIDRYGVEIEEVKLVSLAESRPEIKEILDAWQQLTNPNFSEEQTPASEIPVFEPPKPPTPQRKSIEPERSEDPTEPVPIITDATPSQAAQGYSAVGYSNGLNPGVKIFGLSHAEALANARQAVTYKNMEIQNYVKFIEDCKNEISAAIESNPALAEKYAGNIAAAKSKVEAIQREISALEIIASRAYTEISAERSEADVKAVANYANKEAKQLDKLEETCAGELRASVNNLCMSMDMRTEEAGSSVLPAYVSSKAKQALEEIMAEMEAERK